LVLIVGVVVISISSSVAVKNSATLASALGVSSLIIGITLVSIGTDISEIINSVISCALGHGDIDVGDSIGSSLTQLTLVFGVLPFCCGSFIVKRKEFLIIGSCLILSLFMVYIVIEKGYFTRIDALFLILSLVFYTMVSYNVTKSDMLDKVDLMMEDEINNINKKRILILAIIGFGGVAISSYGIIQSVLILSRNLNIPEYLISFVLVSFGTSLPELSVDISALRRKKYNIAIGDIIGSCIVDATLSVSIGQLLFPQVISADLAIPTILYTIFASFIVVLLVSKRQIMDKKSGILLISIYISSFLFITFL
ncbi:MAG: hypothetical protein GF316_19175, partial [Candidatus Lokiarchaeota archaeon]|nr:hypothetical protein [Candidatus Lokiarchaeota archaeon]